MDVVTLGETMLRLSMSDGQSLEAADAYRVDVAGAESSVAVDLARLGVNAGWVSRLPDSALGRKVAGELRRHGVDVSRVIWARQRSVRVPSSSSSRHPHAAPRSSTTVPAPPSAASSRTRWIGNTCAPRVGYTSPASPPR